MAVAVGSPRMLVVIASYQEAWGGLIADVVDMVEDRVEVSGNGSTETVEVTPDMFSDECRVTITFRVPREVGEKIRELWKTHRGRA